MTEFAAIIPIVIVVLSAIAAMLAEAFRQPGERRVTVRIAVENIDSRGLE